MKEETRYTDPHWLLAATEDQEMEFAVVLTAIDFALHEGQIQQLKQYLIDHSVVINSIRNLSIEKAIEIVISISTHQVWDLFQKFLGIAVVANFDIAVLPVSIRQKKLLICDMDSTIVKTETLDDIALKVGLGEKVSEITARAMRGEMDFRQALNERVSLLKDLSEDVIDDIAENVRFNPGAEALLNAVNKNGIRTVLVSGGFETIVKVVAERLGFDRYICNRVEISNGKLTSKVLEPIVDGSTKLQVLREECQKLSINLDEACSIGDGANDLPMLQAAGLGIGFQGKPLVRASIPCQINYSGLDSVLMMMGIAK